MVFVVQPCSKKGAFEVILKKKISLNSVKTEGFEILARTDYVLIMQKGSVKVSVYPSGKIMIFGVSGEGEVEGLVKSILPI